MDYANAAKKMILNGIKKYWLVISV
jgi:hypothetical protein